jgi:hypothetical protein
MVESCGQLFCKVMRSLRAVKPLKSAIAKLMLSGAAITLLAGCPGATTSSVMIDALLGGSSQLPILTAIPVQTIQQLATVSIDVNNTKKSSPGSDEDMSYTCMWDRTLDGVVEETSSATKSCDHLPGSLAEFGASTGIFKWTPTLNELGKYEVKIKGTNVHGSDERVFVVDVRLSFLGLESLTDVQGAQMTLNWTANPSASGYQILKKKSDGTYEIYKTIVDPTVQSTVLTGLTPLQTYSWRVNAIDSLGQQDGNTVALSAVTADLIRLEVTAAATQLSPGQTALVSVRLKDNGGNYLATSGLSVGIALSSAAGGKSSGTFSAVNDLGTGVYTSTFTATTPGTLNPITASLTQFYYVEQTADMTVEPLKIEILVSAGTVNPGRAVQVTAKIRDYTGALVSWGGHALTFSYSGGSSSGTFGSVTDHSNGTYTATFTGGTAGTATTLGATISTNSQIYATTTVTVAPYQLEITSDHTDLSVTRTAVITAKVKDWEGNYVSSGGQGVAFSILGAAGIATIGPVTDAHNGTYTATLSGLSLGTVVISGSMTPSYQITTSPTIVVRKLRLEISSAASHLMPGQSTTLTARIKDWQGNLLGVGGQSLDFSASGGSSSGSIGSVADLGTGVYTASFAASSAGTALTVSGSIGESYQVDTTASLQVHKWRLYLSSSATSVTVGQSINLSVTVKDYLDIQASAGGQSLFFSQSGGTSSGTVGAIVDHNDGTYTAPFSAISPGSAITVSVSIAQSYEVMQTVSLTVTAVHIALSAVQTSLNPGDAVTVVAQLKDAQGANLSSGTYSISLSNSGGGSTGNFGSASSSGGGAYSATFTGVNAGAATTVTASANLSYIVDSTVQLTVVPWKIEVATSLATLAVGQSATATARIKDWQNAYVTAGGKGLTISAATPGILTVGTTTDNSNGTYTTSLIALNTGTSYLTASINQSYSVTVSPLVTVTPVHLVVTVSQSQVNPGGTANVTASVLDSFGSPIIASTYLITFAASGAGTSTGSFGPSTYIGSGQYQSLFTGNVAGTAIQATAAASLAYVVDSTDSLTVVPWKIEVATSLATLAVGQSGTGTVRIKDWQNAYVTTGGKGVTIAAVTPGILTIGTTTDNADGTYTASIAALNSGTSYLTASISPSYTVTVSPLVTVTPIHLSVTVSQSQVNPDGTALVTAQLKDASGVNIVASTYSVGFTYSGGTSTGSFGATTYLGSGQYQALFTGNVAGTAITLTANSSSGYTVDQTASLTVTPWRLEIAANKTAYVINETGTITGRVKDWQGNFLTTGGKSLALALSTAGIGALGTTTDNSDGTYTATFTANSSGSTAVAASIAQSFTVTVAPTLTVDQAYIHVTVGGGLASKTINSGSTVVARATITSSGGTTVNGFGYGVTFSTSGSGSTVAAVGGVTQISAGVYEITYQGVVAGSALTVTATSSVAYTVSSTATITVIPATVISTSFSSLAVSASTVRSGQTVTVTATLKDAAGNLMPGLTGVSFAMTSGGGISTGTLSAVGTDIGNGQYTAVLTGSVPGTAMNLSSVYGGVSVAQTVSVTVSSGSPTRFTVSGPTTLTANSCSSALSLAFFDSNNNSTTLAANTTFVVSGLGYAVLYSDATCTTPYVSTVISDGVSTASMTVASGLSVSQSIYFKTFYPTTNSLVFTTAGLTQTNLPFSITSSPVLGWLGAIGSIDMLATAGPTSQGIWDGSYSYAYGVTVAKIGTTNYVISTDSSGNRVTKYSIGDGTGGTTAGALSVVGGLGRIFWDAKGIPTGQASGASAAASYCTGLSPGNGINGAWCKGFQTQSGNGDAQFTSPYSSTVMNIGGTDYLFVTDIGTYRIMKYNASTGAYIGWTGRVTNSGATGWQPTGGASGCTTTVAGATTPGWCTGGISMASSSGGAYISGSTSGGVNGGNQFNGNYYITNDGSYLYIGDLNNQRIVQLDPTTGLLVHWMGRVASVSAGGVDGTTTSTYVPTVISCVTNTQSDATSTLAAGQFTPSWCSGGASANSVVAQGANTANSNLNPMFGSPRGIAFYSDGTYNFMLVSDNTNSRINRYFCGAATATPNCANMAGVSITNNAATATYYPGQFFGWTGYVNNVAANIIAIPTSINNLTNLFPFTSTNTTGNPTGGWAYYGNSAGSGLSPMGALSNPYALTVYGTYAYIADVSNQRIMRLNLTGASALRGQFDGWIGRVSITPSGGVAGCASTSSGSPTPGWCKGGTATTGSMLGAFYNPLDVATDGTYLYVNDRDNFRLETYNLATGVPMGMTGLRMSTQQDGWSAAGLPVGSVPVNSSLNPSLANRDGVMSWPEAVVISGDYMYVSDLNNHRIKRFKWLDGSFQGWVGTTTNFVPTGGFGDNGACVNSLTGGYTPGWCKGGGFMSTTNAGFNSPRGIATDGTTYLYVADYGNNRIVRVRMSDGAFMGWIGRILASPSDGDAGCAGAATGTITPGWCIGGTAQTGTALGAYSSPAGLAGFVDPVDNKFYLIVGDNMNYRLQKINVANVSSSGVTTNKWVGKNGTGSAVCLGPDGATAAANGEMVMSWCATDMSNVASTTGSPATAISALNTTSLNNNGMLAGMWGVYVDSTTPAAPVLYVTVTTSSQGRVDRFNASTGTFTGWLGRVATVGGPACSSGSSETVNMPTPGWCTGGAASTSSGDGQLSNGTSGVFADGSYLWVTDSSFMRVLKFKIASDTTDGQFIGWKGKIRIKPTGGPSGATTGAAAVACIAANASTASVSSITPDWCTSGANPSATTSVGGFELDTALNGAAFDTPRGIWVKGAYMYIVDSINGRILTMPK